MNFNLEFTIIGIYSKSSPIGRFEGLIYSKGLSNKESVYYPKNKKLINIKNVGKKITITYKDNQIKEEIK